MNKILIIEDNLSIANTLQEIISEEIKDHTVEIAENGMEGFKNIEKTDYQLIICDLKMPKMSGSEVLSKSMEIKPESNFIMISGHADVEVAVNCLKNGAYDFIEKPIEFNRLITAVKNALNRNQLHSENKNLKSENSQLRKKISKKYVMVGNSEALAGIQDIIGKVASSDARVLITGPNGAGKELVAHAIHEKSDRNTGPLVEVNCAAIPSELIESELFGHIKGSFTGAIKNKQGKFELADKGTLFLDEIGDMSLMAQAKVLRALQEKRIAPVGGDKEIAIDVRVIAATNKDMKSEIAAGRFREDLYHRLSVIEISVPSLAERKSDIPILVEYFINNISNEQGMQKKEFSPQAIAALQDFPWPGNIRELRNVVERLLILGNNPISADDVEKFVKK